MSRPSIQIIGMPGMPEVSTGDDVATMIREAADSADLKLLDRDVIVIAQKIVSKAEGRVVQLDSVEPSARAREWAEAWDKDARVVEVVFRESKRIVRMERGVLISETEHGFVCANAGVDTSNVAADTVTLLPKDPDESAKRIRAVLEKAFGVSLAVIVSDTFGRPWREGLTNVAIGASGVAPLRSYLGETDPAGRPLTATILAIADELAGAAELVMGKLDRIPVAIVRGLRLEPGEEGSKPLIRDPARDLFR